MANLKQDPTEEMIALRARYASLRGKKVEEEPKKESNEETPHVETIPTKIKKPNLYIQLMKDDISNLISKIKKFMGLRGKQKPLDLSWLERNKSRFWK